MPKVTLLVLYAVVPATMGCGGSWDCPIQAPEPDLWKLFSLESAFWRQPESSLDQEIPSTIDCQVASPDQRQQWIHQESRSFIAMLRVSGDTGWTSHAACSASSGWKCPSLSYLETSKSIRDGDRAATVRWYHDAPEGYCAVYEARGELRLPGDDDIDEAWWEPEVECPPSPTMRLTSWGPVQTSTCGFIP